MEKGPSPKKRESEPSEPGSLFNSDRPSEEKKSSKPKQKRLPGIWKKRLFFAGYGGCYPGD